LKTKDVDGVRASSVPSWHDILTSCGAIGCPGSQVKLGFGQHGTCLFVGKFASKGFGEPLAHFKVV